MNECPCCSNQLLRHVRLQEIYWFCPSCRQEMPNLSFSLGLAEISNTNFTTLKVQNALR